MPIVTRAAGAVKRKGGGFVENLNVSDRLSSILSSVAPPRSADEILNAEVMGLYRSTSDEFSRARIASNLRDYAKRNGVGMAGYDKLFRAFERNVNRQEREARAATRAGQRFRIKENHVGIETTAEAIAELGITVRFNLLYKEVEVDGLPDEYSKENAANILPVYLRDYFKSRDFDGASIVNVEGCLNCIADRNRYNPVKEYLDRGAWDYEDRFPTIYQILGVTSPKYQNYIQKWFIQCVALGLNDEERPIGSDGALVLQGAQNAGKTSFFRVLSPYPRWFVEGASIDMRDKDSQIKALRGWITELGELDSTLKKEQSSLKAFITLPEDRIRLPYGRTETRAPRRTCFCGTVNPEDYLKDETGSRRFWTVPINGIKKDVLFSLRREWVDQLWQQAYYLYLQNRNSFRLTDDEVQQLQEDNREFEQPMRYEVEIREKLDYSLAPQYWGWWSAAEVADLFSDMPRDTRSVGKALSKIVKDNPPTSPTSPQNAENVKTGHNHVKLYRLPLYHEGQEPPDFPDYGGMGGFAGDEIL